MALNVVPWPSLTLFLAYFYSSLSIRTSSRRVSSAPFSGSFVFVLTMFLSRPFKVLFSLAGAIIRYAGSLVA